MLFKEHHAYAVFSPANATATDNQTHDRRGAFHMLPKRFSKRADMADPYNLHVRPAVTFTFAGDETPAKVAASVLFVDNRRAGWYNI